MIEIVLDIHYLIVWPIILGIFGGLMAILIGKYKYNKKYSKKDALDIYKDSIEGCFAMSLMFILLFKSELLLKPGEFLVPMVLGCLSIMVRIFYKIIKNCT